MSDAKPAAPVLDTRRAGVLLHPTSLPGDGAGVLGGPARRFIDFLVSAGFRLWQVLPLGPPHADGSPYQARSAHAGDTRLVDVAELVAAGWLEAEQAALPAAQRLHAARLGFERRACGPEREERERFEADSRGWLADHALFEAIRSARAGEAWWQWPAPLAAREPAALVQAAVEHAESVADLRFGQFLFHRQWHALREYATARDVRLFGDVPIFVALDSSDCWAWRRQFLLADDGRPTVVAGVPPDYFSREGQRWGNPLFDWPRMRADGYRWWRSRMAHQLALFDVVRVDHFRGFAAHWEIPAADRTAVNGRWAPGPGAELFEALRAESGALPLVAEDLGTITDDVVELRERLELPGMKVMQFAFGGDAANPYLPHNHVPNAVVYTGTHDNDTTLGWVASLEAAARAHATRYLRCAREDVGAAVMDAALASVARWCVLPMQDVLGLGEGERMNLPGTVEGNWGWGFEWAQVDERRVDDWRERNARYGRGDQAAE